MAELNVNDITTNTIDPTDKVYGFNADESKAPTVKTLLGAAPGIMSTGTCATAAATALKAVTSDDWEAKPGRSILIEFSTANTASDVSLSINQGNAIPVYALNTSIRLGSGTIPAGPMIFTLSADSTKFYAHTVVVDTEVTSGSSKPVTSGGVANILSNYAKIVKFTLGTQKTYSFEMECLHTYRITLGHPILPNKTGCYLIMLQNETQYNIINMSNENNYTLSINNNILTITTTTDYGFGYIEDMGEHA